MNPLKKALIVAIAIIGILVLWGPISALISLIISLTKYVFLLLLGIIALGVIIYLVLKPENES
jgi:hypothetical protein